MRAHRRPAKRVDRPEDVAQRRAARVRDRHLSGIAEIALFTGEVEATVAFYRLVLASDPVAEWPGGALFAAGDLKVLVHERSAAMDGGPPNEDHVAVGVTDLDATCAVLRERGLRLLVEPRDYPWGRSAYLRDPDGRLVEVTQQ